MKIRRIVHSSARGIFLVEQMALLAAGLLLLMICGRLFWNTLYVHRLAAQHADRIAVVDHFNRQLQSDIAASEFAFFSDDRLTLCRPEGEFAYHFSESRVDRLVKGVIHESWFAARLRFSPSLPGPRGNLLVIDCIEDAPPKATRLKPRIDRLAYALPGETAP